VPCKAVAHPKRLMIIYPYPSKAGEKGVGELAAEIGLSLSTPLSHHSTCGSASWSSSTKEGCNVFLLHFHFNFYRLADHRGLAI